MSCPWYSPIAQCRDKLLTAACLATAAVWVWLDGFLYNGAGNVFAVIVDLHLLLVGTGWAVTVALAGALPTAVRAARQSVIEALRSVN